MNKGPFLHSKHNTRKIVLYYIFACIPLILYGFYKNGILVYAAKKTTFLGLLKPLVFPLIGYMIGLLCEFLYCKLRKKDVNWKEDIFYSFTPLYTMLASMLVPTSIHSILFFTSLFLFFFAIKWIPFLGKINKVACFCTIFFALLAILGKLQFLNPLEETKEYAFQLLDLLFGRNVGGMCTTNIIFVLLAYFFLSVLGFYKSDIPIYIMIPYFILSLLFGLSGHHFLVSMTNFLSHSLIFIFVLVATDSISSPYTKLGRCIYGILVGIISFFLGMLLDPTLALLLTITVISIFSSFFDALVLQRHV